MNNPGLHTDVVWNTGDIFKIPYRYVRETTTWSLEDVYVIEQLYGQMPSHLAHDIRYIINDFNSHGGPYLPLAGETNAILHYLIEEQPFGPPIEVPLRVEP